MSKQEQAALVAWINSFRPSKRVSAFEQLADGRVLTEILNSIDATHFKPPPARGPNGSSGSAENWVLRSNNLKRLYRLILSYPLAGPHKLLSASSLPEPSFSSVVKNPESGEGLLGLLQIVRITLALAVWSPDNERVISKIQGLGEGHMAELMKSIEEIMSSMPQTPEQPENAIRRTPSPTGAVVPESPHSPIAGIRQNRDRLARENDDLRSSFDALVSQVAALNTSLDEIKTERDEALERLAVARDSAGGSENALRSARIDAEMDNLRAELVQTEEELARATEELNKRTEKVQELSKAVAEFEQEAGEAARLRDQLDEYRHAAEKLKRSENVIDKYKKKLEETASLRRDHKKVEDENAQLHSRVASLETELRLAGPAKSQNDTYKDQLDALRKRAAQQAEHVLALSQQLEEANSRLAETERLHAQDKEELQLQQDRVKELELAGIRRSGSDGSLAGNTTLGDEIDISAVQDAAAGEAALQEEIADLRAQLHALQAQMDSPDKPDKLQATEAARDRYQADYVSLHKDYVRLKAALDEQNSTTSRAEPPGDSNQAAIEPHRDSGLTDNGEHSAARAEIADLKERDRMHLEDIKRLLLEKVDLQSSGIDQREKALEREKELSRIKEMLQGKGVDRQVQEQLLHLSERNSELAAQVKQLQQDLQNAYYDSASETESPSQEDDEASVTHRSPRRPLASENAELKAELKRARAELVDVEKRYKLEQQLMLSAWHDIGRTVVRQHVTHAATRRSQPRPVPQSWLGRQRRWQEEAAFMTRVQDLRQHGLTCILRSTE